VQSKRFDHKELILLVLVLILAAATRFYRLGDASFWLDEVYTVHSAHLPWSTLWVTAYNPTPPLFFSVIKLLTEIGDSEWWYRMPSAVAGVFTVLFVYLATRKLQGAWAAFAASVLIALSIPNIEYSQEARAYALVSLFISLSFMGLVSLATRWRDSAEDFGFLRFLRSGGGLYMVGTLAALYSHNTAVFYWLGAQLFFVAWWIKPFRFDRVCLVSWFIANVIVLLLWLPWFFASLTVIEIGRFSWLQQFPFPKAFTTWVNVHGVVIPFLALFGLYKLRGNSTAMVLLVSLVLFSSFVIWAYGFIESPVYMRRTIIWGSLFTCILAGIAISELPRVVGGVALLLLTVNGLFYYRTYDLEHMAESQDWRSAGEIFAQYEKPEDILFFRSQFVSEAFLYYAMLSAGKADADWRVLGIHCGHGTTRYGKINEKNDLLVVSWSKDVPNWKYPASDITNSTLWIVESLCPARSERRLSSDKWAAQFWDLEEIYKSRAVRLYRMQPKAL